MNRPSFFHHLHPPTIPEAQARWRYTLAAGGLAVFLVLVLLVTGALEMFYYVPTADGAALSVQAITFLVPFGGLVRGLHYWAAQALVAVAVVHLLRVIFTGAYARPRRFNYLLGIALLVLVVLADFTGYVLRWDTGVRWALVTGTNLLKTIPLIGDGLYLFAVGADRPVGATLLRFYAWHIFGLMLFLLGLGVWHLFRVRRDGGIAAPPPREREPGRITRFELVRREALAALLASVVLVLLAGLWPAPLGAALGAESTLNAADARAPWFFLWVQQLLRLGDPFWLGVAVPLAALALLVAVPYAFPAPPADERGRWFPPGARAAQLVVAALFLLILALTLAGWLA